MLVIGMGDEDVMVSKFYDVSLEEKRRKERSSCEDGGRDKSDVATRRGMSGATGSWKKQGRILP